MLLSLWQKFVNRFYKSGECEGLMEDASKPSVSCYEELKERKEIKERDLLSKTKQLTESVDLFLKSHYDFRYNVLTEETEFRLLERMNEGFQPVNQRVLNTICLEAHEAGIGCWDRDLSRCIYSTRIAEYHPFRLYLDELPVGHGWLTETEFLSFIAVSESTPGPLAINMATFIGASQGGFWGALCATLGVVLPSFVIILLVASVLQNLMKYAGINAVLGGVRPCVVAMILATAVNMALSTLAGFAADKAGIAPDLRSIVVFLLLWGLHALCRRKKGKAPSPIGMILFSAGLGILFWGI